MALQLPTKTQYENMTPDDWGKWIESLDQPETNDAFEALSYVSWYKPNYEDLQNILEERNVAYEIPVERAYQDSGLFSNRYDNYLSDSPTYSLTNQNDYAENYSISNLTQNTSVPPELQKCFVSEDAEKQAVKTYEARIVQEATLRNQSLSGQINSFKNNVANYYDEAIHFFESDLLVDMSEELGFNNVEMPQILWDVICEYGEEYKRNPHPELELGNLLQDLLGIPEEKVQVTNPNFWDLVVKLNEGLSEIGKWDGEGSIESYLATSLRSNTKVLESFSELIENPLLQVAYQQKESLENAYDEIMEMQTVEDLYSYLLPFQGHQESWQTMLLSLGIQPEWFQSVTNPKTKRVQTGTGYHTQTGEPYPIYSTQKIPPVQPKNCPDHIWNLCLELGKVHQDQAFWQNVKTVGSIGLPIGIAVATGILAASGIGTPFALAIIGGVSATGTAGLFAASDIYTQTTRFHDIQAGSTVGRHTEFEIGSDEYEELAAEAVEAAWIRGAVDMTLAGVGTIAGIGIASKVAQISKVRNLSRLSILLVDASANGTYGSADAFLSAVSDKRNTTAYIATADRMAGGTGEEASGLKAVAFEMTIGALFGAGFSAGSHVVSGLKPTSKSIHNHIDILHSQGRTREHNGTTQIQKKDGSWVNLDEANLLVVFSQDGGEPRVFLEGEDITGSKDSIEAPQKKNSAIPKSNADIHSSTFWNQSDAEFALRELTKQTGNEHILFRVETENGPLFTVVEGNKNNVDFDALADTWEVGARDGHKEFFGVPIAHSHPNGDITPSVRDLHDLAKAAAYDKRSYVHKVIDASTGNEFEFEIRYEADGFVRIYGITDLPPKSQNQFFELVKLVEEQVNDSIRNGNITEPGRLIAAQPHTETVSNSEGLAIQGIADTTINEIPPPYTTEEAERHIFSGERYGADAPSYKQGTYTGQGLHYYESIKTMERNGEIEILDEITNPETGAILIQFKVLYPDAPKPNLAKSGIKYKTTWPKDLAKRDILEISNMAMDNFLNSQQEWNSYSNNIYFFSGIEVNYKGSIYKIAGQFSKSEDGSIQLLSAWPDIGGPAKKIFRSLKDNE